MTNAVSRDKAAKQPRIQTVVYLILVSASILAASLILCLPECQNVSSRDEFGYLANAALLCGNNLSDYMVSVPYYSQGYSFCLVPLYLLFWPDITALMRAACILNSLFLVGCFLLAYACAKKMFPRWTQVSAIAASCALALFSGNLFQARYLSPETLLTMLSWLALFFALRICEKGNALDVLLFSLVLGYSYMVHARALALWIAGALFMLTQLLLRRIKITHFLLFAAVLASIFVSQSFIKSWFKAELWTTSTNTEINDYSGQVGKLHHILSPNGFFGFCRVALGQLLGITISSLTLTFFGTWRLLEELFALHVAFKRQKKELLPAHISVGVFVLGGFLASWAVSSVYILEPLSLDAILYSRYIDYVMPLVSLFGLYSLSCSKKQKILTLFIACAIFMLSTGFIIDTFWTDIKNTFGAGRNVVAYYFFSKNITPLQYVFIVLLVLGSTLWLVQKVYIPFRKTILAGIVAVTYVLLSFPAAEYMAEITPVSNEDIAALKNIIPQGSTVGTNDEHVMVGTLRLLLAFPETNIFLYDEDATADYLLTYSYSGYKTLWKEHLTIYRGNNTNLFAHVRLNAVETAPCRIELLKQNLANGTQFACKTSTGWTPIYNQGSSDNSILEKQNSDSDSYCIETNTGIEDVRAVLQERIAELQQQQEPDAVAIAALEEQIAALGQMQYSVQGVPVALNPGSYRVDFTLEALNLDACEQDWLGQCEVRIGSSGRISLWQTMTHATFADGGSQTLSIEFNVPLGSAQTSVQFMVHTTENVQLRITDISYQLLEMEAQVLAQGTDDLDTATDLIALDSEGLPVYAVINEAWLPYTLGSDLQSSAGRWVKPIAEQQLQDIGQSFLIVPADDYALLQRLLPQYSVLARLKDFAMLAPSNSAVYTAFREAGGQPLSEGTALNLRYFTGASYKDSSDVSATVPTGSYQLRYQVSVTGAPLHATLGSLILRYGSTEIAIPLTRELVRGDLIAGTETIELPQDDRVSACVRIRSELQGSNVEVWLTPLDGSAPRTASTSTTTTVDLPSENPQETSDDQQQSQASQDQQDQQSQPDQPDQTVQTDAQADQGAGAEGDALI